MSLVHRCDRHGRTRRGATHTCPQCQAYDPRIPLVRRSDVARAAGDWMRSDVATVSVRGGDGALARVVRTRAMTVPDTPDKASVRVRGPAARDTCAARVPG